MKYYMYVDMTQDGKDSVYIIMSDRAIISDYWDYWKDMMVKVSRFEPDNIPKMEQECVYDFCTIHWAYEIDDERFKLLESIIFDE